MVTSSIVNSRFTQTRDRKLGQSTVRISRPASGIRPEVGQLAVAPTLQRVASAVPGYRGTDHVLWHEA